MSLKARLAARIAASGPLTVAQYMEACLHDPQDGYYATRPALGRDGDFITAPLVSQMFGELIGLWVVETWRSLGSPAKVRLVELGPGDGTLMSDALRAARLAPDFIAAAELLLMERSEPLRRAQAASLATAPLKPVWIDGLGQIPDDAPLIVVSNEFLDCLPTRQYLRTDLGWREQVVALDELGELAFTLHPAFPGFDPARKSEAIELGQIVELSEDAFGVGHRIGHLIRAAGGAALMIDYGPGGLETGDTLQALRNHRKVDPLDCPGEADLTIHADFPTFLAGVAQGSGEAISNGLVSQRTLLLSLGIKQRADALVRARPDKAFMIAGQMHRLIDIDKMGELFKAACVYYPKDVSPPGFPGPDDPSRPAIPLARGAA